jgi:hypothetical protein
VLSGGGGKGAYQIGCWKALRRAELARFAVISGTSVGALNGALISMGDLNRAEQIWTDLQEQHVLKSVYWRKYVIGLLLYAIVCVVVPFHYVLELFMSAVFSAGLLGIFFLIMFDYGIRPESLVLIMVWVPLWVLFLVYLIYSDPEKHPREVFKKCLRTISVRLGRFLWVGTSEPLLNLIKSHISAEKLHQSRTKLFATISVIEKYWDPFTPKFYPAVPRRARNENPQ